MGSVVNKDLLANTVVAGVPAHLICSLDAYVARYQQKMMGITAAVRTALRTPLTQKRWGESC